MKKEKVRPPPPTDVCSFWNIGKQKYCSRKILATKGDSKHCGLHNTELNVICKLCNSFVKTSRMEKHLKVCPALPSPPPALHCHDHNSPEVMRSLDPQLATHPFLSSVGDEKYPGNDASLRRVGMWLGRLLPHGVLPHTIPYAIGRVPVLEKSFEAQLESAGRPGVSIDAIYHPDSQETVRQPNAVKHFLQLSSLAAHVKRVVTPESKAMYFVAPPHSTATSPRISPIVGDSTAPTITTTTTPSLSEGTALSSPKVQVIEYGSGRGTLSHAVATGEGTDEGTLFALVDRETSKGKVEPGLTLAGFQARRATIDIQHLDVRNLSKFWETAPIPQSFTVRQGKKGKKGKRELQKVEQPPGQKEANMSASSKDPILCISKHLCGPATDLTLMSLRDCAIHRETIAVGGEPVAKRLEGEKGRSAPPLGGIIIALCCHGKLHRSMYCNHPFLSAIGVTTDEAFKTLTRFSTLGVSGSGRVPPTDPEGGGSTSTLLAGEPGSGLEAPQDPDAPLSPAETVVVGRRIKRMLDLGRILWVETILESSCELLYFVEPRTTMENTILCVKSCVSPLSLQ